MQVNLQIDSQAILNQLRYLGKDGQAPYILANTLNTLASRVQYNLRQNLSQSLNLRHRTWILNQVRIESGTWATKTRLKVRIALTDAAAFIARMETGEQRLPFGGHSYLAVPNPDVFGNKIIDRNNPLRIKRLAFQETPWGLRGQERTFMIHGSGGIPLIMQRQDVASYKTAGNSKALKAMEKATKGQRKSSGLRVLYSLIKTAKIPKKITWYDTANETVMNEQTGIFYYVIRKALDDSKGKR